MMINPQIITGFLGAGLIVFNIGMALYSLKLARQNNLEHNTKMIQLMQKIEKHLAALRMQRIEKGLKDE